MRTIGSVWLVQHLIWLKMSWYEVPHVLNQTTENFPDKQISLSHSSLVTLQLKLSNIYILHFTRICGLAMKPYCLIQY